MLVSIQLIPPSEWGGSFSLASMLQTQIGFLCWCLESGVEAANVGGMANGDRIERRCEPLDNMA